MSEKLIVRERDKEILIRMLSALFPGVKIYLFGSYARGDAKISSDIDLALDYGTKELTRFDIARAKNVIEALGVVNMVDVVNFNRAPEYLQKIIKEEGIEWTK